MTVYYKDINDLTQRNMAVFDKVYNSGEESPQEGIYSCKTCKVTKIVFHKENFPLHDHFDPLPQGFVKWQLIVANLD